MSVAQKKLYYHGSTFKYIKFNDMPGIIITDFFIHIMSYKYFSNIVHSMAVLMRWCNFTLYSSKALKLDNFET